MTTVQYTATNSERSTLSLCRHLWWLKYGLGIRPATKSRALRFGTIWHRAMEAWWSFKSKGMSSLETRVNARASIELDCEEMLQDTKSFSLEDPYALSRSDILEDKATLTAMLIGYHDTYFDEDVGTMILNEDTLVANTITRNGTKSGWSLFQGGVDKLWLDDEHQLWISDHKTSTRPLHMWRSQNEYNPQAVTYGFLVRQVFGVEPVGVVYDLALKSRPATVDQYKVVKGGKRLSRQLPANATSTGFRAALAKHGFAMDDEHWYEGTHDALVANEKAGKFFRREYIRFEPGAIERCSHELYSVATELRRLHAAADPLRNALLTAGEDWRDVAQGILSKGNPKMWRATNACYTYGKPCRFMDLCRRPDDRDALEDFRLSDSVHEETTATMSSGSIPQLEGDA